MSNTQFVFLNKSGIPARDELQQAISDLGFTMSLDKQFAPFSDEGFSLCEWLDFEGAGFVLEYVSVAELVEEDEEFKEIVGDKDYCICLSWGGSIIDCACVMMVSCAFAKSFDALVSYNGDDPDSFEYLLDGAKEAIELATQQNE